VLDALTGVAYHDDGQVSVIQAAKRFALAGEPAGASVSISPL
jgi:Holliday junction resolvase RusA-like endonuclease